MAGSCGIYEHKTLVQLESIVCKPTIPNACMTQKCQVFHGSVHTLFQNSLCPFLHSDSHCPGQLRRPPLGSSPGPPDAGRCPFSVFLITLPLPHSQHCDHAGVLNIVFSFYFEIIPNLLKSCNNNSTNNFFPKTVESKLPTRCPSAHTEILGYNGYRH